MKFKITFLACLLILGITATQAQDNPTPFYLGVDLSYVNEMEDCGAIYYDQGEAQDPFAILAGHGANLVRARLWHNPDWTNYSTLEDVEKTLGRAQALGMATLLDIHYSDNWADPGRQEIPAAWEDLQTDAEFAEAVYTYTKEVLTSLHEKDIIPTFVQVGNETNSGILKQGTAQNWERDALLFNAGIQAIRDFAAATDSNPQIMLHVAQPENTGWWFNQAESFGITDFDVIGISYYPQWSTYSIPDMGGQVSYLRQRFGKKVMVVETAYAWTRDAVDETADNILNQGIRGYPFSPEGQRQFMTDLSQSLLSNGAIGVVYWEPAWVSTSCSTRWGQGSHWENATLFDFDNELHEGADFLGHPYLYPTYALDGEIETAYGEALIKDPPGDAFEGIAAFDLTRLYALETDESIYLAIKIAGNILDERGNYLLYFDTTADAEGADIDVASRPILVDDPFKPEFRLDLTITERNETINGSYTLNAWVEGEWQKLTFTGGVAIQPSVIEIQLPKYLLNDPQILNIAILSTDQTRAHTAADILGSNWVPYDWSEAILLDMFYPLMPSN